MRLPERLAVLAETCRRRGWTFTSLDPHSGYLCEVSNGRHAFLSGAGGVVAYPLNNATAVTIATDKTHTATLMTRAGIRVPKGGHFFTTRRFEAVRGPGRMVDDAVVFAKSTLGFPVFVKPNDGSGGAFADMAYSGDDIRRQFEAMAASHAVALVQEVLRGVEYRVVAVDGEPLLAYERRATGLPADGVSTIEQLLRNTNDRFVAQGVTPIPVDSPHVREEIARAGYAGLDAVPPLGAALPVSARRNISAGAAVGDVRTRFNAAQRAHVARVARTIGLRVCGIDVMTATDFDDVDAYTLVEINGNPSLAGIAGAGHLDAAVAVWERVAQTWFSEAER